MDTVGTVTRAAPEIDAWVEGLDALDGVSEQVQNGVRRAIPQESRLKDALSGTWLGHPLHPPLTDVVIGAWTSALLLDLMGGRRSRQASDRLIAIGIACAVPTAATGLSDWAELRGGRRRLGTVHALGNSAALALHALSWAARRNGHRRRGVMLSATGYGVATIAAWLGGQLSLARGVGVNQSAFDDHLADWTPVCDESALAGGELVGEHAGHVAVLLVRKDDRVHALADRCTHRGCSLHEGELAGDEIVCPCHGSRFRLDGSIAKGPAAFPQTAFEVRSRKGTIEIRSAPDGRSSRAVYSDAAARA
jgi:nitrite reductase/ring-hydroxylating ferredoxin subunit/uncharacterized membrane protein